MWTNTLTIGMRVLAGNRIFALINILGLGIGMAACILLLLYVRYERSYDEWLPEHARAHMVQTFFDDPKNNRKGGFQNSAYIVGRSLAKDFPEIEKFAYVGPGKPVIIQAGQSSTAEVLMVDPAFLDIVQLPLVKGDRKSALANINSVLLSQSEAARRFPAGDAMGQTLTMIRNGQSIDYKVTGILRDLPGNSHLVVNLIVPFNRIAYGDNEAFYTRYGWNSGFNYVQLRKGARWEDMAPRMAAWEKRNIPKENFGGVMVGEGDTTDWRLVKVTDVHLGEASDGGQKPGSNPKTIATFALIGMLILLMACVNFINLSTARAGQRAREVALRKVLGASRRQLIAQFLAESLMVAAISMLVALAIVELTLPMLARFLNADLAISYLGTGGVILPIVALVALVGLLAGLYPAVVLSRFEPALVLKANRGGTDGQGSGKLRSALVVAQFAVSIVLIICTAVVTAQTIYARTADAGYNRDGLLQVTGIGRKQLLPLRDNLLTAIRQVPGVEAVGLTMIGVNTGSRINTLVRVDGNPEPIEVGNYAVDEGFFKVMGLETLAGRWFDLANPKDNAEIPPNDDAAQEALVARGGNVVLNESAVRKLGLGTPEQAVGKTIRVAMVEERFGLAPATIVGVVPDARFRSFRDPYEPIMYAVDRSAVGEMVVRVKASEAGAVRDRVEAVWKRLAPQVPFEAAFAGTIVAEQYDADEARAQIFAGFAGLAILVACLGLYGLATFTAERRTREIGIRKVLGARDRDIVRLLVWQFSQPVLLANLIAWPIAWWLMRGWLDGFTARIALGPQWFLLAGGLAALIAVVTITGHALKVARANPADALRYE